MGLLFVKKILRICLSASSTQYTVTIAQVQESVSDFNPESESQLFLNPGVGVSQKMRTPYLWIQTFPSQRVMWCLHGGRRQPP